MDMKWNSNFNFLLSDIISASLTLTVFRPAEGKTRLVHHGRTGLRRFFGGSQDEDAVQIGSATYALKGLLQCPRFTRNIEAPLKVGDQEGAALLKFRVRASPLLPPKRREKSLPPPSDTNNKPQPPRPARRMSRAALAKSSSCIFYTPENSEGEEIDFKECS